MLIGIAHKAEMGGVSIMPQFHHDTPNSYGPSCSNHPRKRLHMGQPCKRLYVDRSCERQPDLHKTAPRMSVSAGAVVLRDNKILFVRQTYGRLRGQWSLPTGFVDPGETPDMAALRETKEEAGITAGMDGLLGICNVDWEGEPQIYIVFLCHHIDGEPLADGKENDRAQYFSLEDMEAFDEPFEALCEWIARSVLQGSHHALPPRDISSLHPCYKTAFMFQTLEEIVEKG